MRNSSKSPSEARFPMFGSHNRPVCYQPAFRRTIDACLQAVDDSRNEGWEAVPQRYLQDFLQVIQGSLRKFLRRATVFLSTISIDIL